MSPTPTDPNQAQAWISGEAPDQTIDFYIPRGNTGLMGPQGPIGPSLAVGTVETVMGPAAPGTVGPQGPIGLKGDPGGITDGTELGTANLNTITVSGVYKQTLSGANASLANNYPFTGIMASLLVFRARPTDIIQVMEPGNGIRAGTVSFKRASTDGGATWSAWRAFASTRIDQTAGRAVYVWDDANNRDQLVHGDTGWRDVSPLSGTAAWVRLRRINNMIHVWIADWANGTSSDIIALPSGFQTGTNSIAAYWGVRSSAPLFVSVNGPSSLVQAAAAPQGFTAYITFPTVNSWPTTLPGTAHASIPNL